MNNHTISAKSPKSGKPNNLLIHSIGGEIKHANESLGGLTSDHAMLAIAIYCGFAPTARQCGSRDSKTALGSIAHSVERAVKTRERLLDYRKRRKQLTERDRQRLLVAMRRLHTLESRLAQLLAEFEVRREIEGFTAEIRSVIAKEHLANAMSIPVGTRAGKSEGKSPSLVDSGTHLKRARDRSIDAGDPNHLFFADFDALYQKVQQNQNPAAAPSTKTEVA